MSNKLTLLAASSLLTAGLAFTALAQQSAPPSPGKDQGMMGNGNMPTASPQQMSRMMENCNRMMESRMQQHPAPAPQQEKKG